MLGKAGDLVQHDSLHEEVPLLGDKSFFPDSPSESTDTSLCGTVEHCLRRNDKPLAYTVLTTLGTVPTLLFSSLHMVAFLKIHGLSAGQVFAAHTVYIVWNTLNDVVAGYGNDFYVARYGSRLSILCCAQVVWVSTTSLPFLPLGVNRMDWFAGTLYYLLCIALFDGCLSVVGVARVALVSEVTKREGECVHFKRLNCIFGNAEGLVGLVGYALWSETFLWPFRAFLAVVIAVAVFCCFWSTWRLQPYLQQAMKKSEARSTDSFEFVPPLLFLRSLTRDAWVFIAITALHELQGVTMSQFLVMTTDSLLGEVTKAWRVFFLGALGAAGGVTTFCLTWVAEQIGVYKVLLWTFLLKSIGALLILALTMYVGITIELVCSTMVINAVSVAVFAGFHFVIMVSLVDQLSSQRRRVGPDHPLAAYPQACGPAMLIGMSAFFVKPFNSVGPVVGASLFAGDGKLDAVERVRVFYALVALPLIVGIFQLFLWSQLFSLRERPQQEVQ